MNDDDDISSLWQRHLLAAVRDNLSAASVQVIPSGARSLDGDDLDLKRSGQERQVGDGWDEQMDSVVDALQELAIQSPTTINTTETYSPETPWFADREGYAETALSSPQNSSWSRTIAPSKALQSKRLSSHNEPADITSNSSKSPLGKGKSPSKTTTSSLQPWSTSHLPSSSSPDSYENYYRSYNPNARDVPPDPPTVTVRYAPSRASQMMESPPEEVHVLILTWAKPNDKRGDEGQLLSPTLDIETYAVRASFKRRGYKVQCRHIPEDYPTAAVETILDRFLDKSAEKRLLVVYYHGYGDMEGGRMVFSSDQSATSSFIWDDVRDPIMQSPGDILLIFDCRPLPHDHDDGESEALMIEAGMISSPSTKQLLGICASPTLQKETGSGKMVSVGGRVTTPSMSSGMMTESLCRMLDGKFGDRKVSLQNLCSNIREDLRRVGSGTGDMASKVFVTQLGGGQLGDICLPWFVHRD